MTETCYLLEGKVKVITDEEEVGVRSRRYGDFLERSILYVAGKGEGA
jgi:uncharacterized cupin superfamily protein